MFKNKTELQKKEIHKYPSVDFISQELSKKLETELQKFVTYYNGGKAYQIDLMHGDFYPGAVEGRFARIVDDFMVNLTQDWSLDKLKQYQGFLKGHHIINLSRELMKDLEKVINMDYGYYTDFGKQIPFIIIPHMSNSIEGILEGKNQGPESSDITTLRKGLVGRILKLVDTRTKKK